MVTCGPWPESQRDVQLFSIVTRELYENDPSTMDNAIARPHFLLRWRNWTHNLGLFLAQHNVTPNDISLLGVMFAATAGAALYFSLQPIALDRAVLLLIAAAA